MNHRVMNHRVMNQVRWMSQTRKPLIDGNPHREHHN
jgi:hypothetical protein